MKKVVKLDEALLRQLIKEQMEELDELTMSQAKMQGPMKKFMDGLNQAKQGLVELYQQTTDQRSGDQVRALYNGIQRLAKAAEQMPELASGRSK